MAADDGSAVSWWDRLKASAEHAADYALESAAPALSVASEKAQAAATLASEKASELAQRASVLAQEAGSRALDSASHFAEELAVRHARLSLLSTSDSPSQNPESRALLADRLSAAGSRAVDSATHFAEELAVRTRAQPRNTPSLTHFAQKPESRAEIAERLRALRSTLLLSEEELRLADWQEGVTPDLRQLLGALSVTVVEEAARTLPPPPAPPLSAWQEAHSRAALAHVPAAAELHACLVPARLSEQRFWQAYFTLCSGVLAEFQPKGQEGVLTPPALQSVHEEQARAAAVTLPQEHQPAPARAAEPPPALAVAHFAASVEEGPGDLEAFLERELQGTGSGDEGEDDNAALEEEFAAMLGSDEDEV